MNKKFKISLLIFLSIIYLFGVFFSGVYIHELVHKFEYRNIPKENESICVSIIMNCSGYFGMHSADYDSVALKEWENIKHKELYPSIIVIIYWVALLFLFVWFWEVQ